VTAPGCSELKSLLEAYNVNEVSAESDDSKMSEAQEHSDPHCSWYIEQDKGSNKWKKVPHTFTKGAALSLQATIGTSMFYGYNYYEGGLEQLRKCFDLHGLLMFGPVGVLFGLGAVFGFLAQDGLSPGSYALIRKQAL